MYFFSNDELTPPFFIFIFSKEKDREWGGHLDFHFPDSPDEVFECSNSCNFFGIELKSSTALYTKHTHTIVQGPDSGDWHCRFILL